MPRGKYAERARTKRDADQRYAIAVAEGNQLRQKIRELRHLREENEVLSRRISVLEKQVEVGASDRVEELEARIAFLEVDRVAIIANHEFVRDRAFKGLMALADQVTDERRDAEWWSLMAGIAEHIITLPKGVKGNRILTINYLKEILGERPTPTFSQGERRRGEELSERRNARRSARRPKIDYSNPSQRRRFTKAEEARYAKTSEGEQDG